MKWLKYILSLTMCLMCIVMKGQYNPTDPPEPPSPGEPVKYYTLTLRVDPASSGSLNGASGRHYVGEEVYVNTSSNTNFTFIHWEDDLGNVYKNGQSFRFVMPDRNVTLTARYEYTPGSPGEPNQPNIPKYSRVYFSANPASSGSFNRTSGELQQVGSTFTVNASSNTNFVFREWTRDGEYVTNNRQLSYTVTEEDAYFVANFDYVPGSPAEPQTPVSQHRVFLSCNPAGTSTFNRDNGQYFTDGSTVSIYSYPSNNFSIVNWTVDGEVKNAGRTLEFTMPDHDVYVVLNTAYTPGSPGEPNQPENMAGVYGLTDYVAINERHLYPIYLDNTLHKAKGMVIDVQFPSDFTVEPDKIETTKVTATHNVSYQDLGNNNYRITTLGTENTLEGVNAIAMYIPVTIPESAVIDSTYLVKVKYGVLTNMDNSQTALKTHNGGLRILEKGFCRITTSLSQYGTIEGGGRYKIGDMVTLTAVPNAGCKFISWTDGTTDNPYVFEATQSLVIGANFRDLGYIPDYPSVSDLGMEQELAEVTLSWTEPDLEPMWTDCREHLMPEDELPQLLGYYVYRNGTRITAEPIDATTFTDTAMDIYTVNAYTVTVVFSDRTESEPSKAVNTVRKLYAPQISANGTTITIVNEREPEAYILYAINGDVTAKGVPYEGSFTVDRNCVINAYSILDGCYDSDIVSDTIDVLQAAKPYFKLSGDSLYIYCETPDVEIYYTMDGSKPNENSIRYQDGIKLYDNRMVRAIALSEYFNASEIADFQPDIFTCDEPQFRYNGRFVEIVGQNDYQIKYQDRDNVWNTYYGEFDAQGINTFNAYCVKEYFNDSPIVSFTTPAYYGGDKVVICEYPDTIHTAFDWCPDKVDNIQELQVIGNIGNHDYYFLNHMGNLKHLAMSEANSTYIPDGAFADNYPYGPIFVILPDALVSTGESLFSNSNVAAVKCKNSSVFNACSFDGSNPHLLLYADEGVPIIMNTIINGVADYIGLSKDTVYNAPASADFYCPIEFTANRIELYYEFHMRTPLRGGTAGWETLTVPFDVDDIFSINKGHLAPFGANKDKEEFKPFWLERLGSYGFVPADRIEANRPYIISMPNNDAYADDYIITGTVIFSANNVTVPVTEQLIDTKGDLSFVPTTQRIKHSPYISSINRWGLGESFDSDVVDVYPFEAYLTKNGSRMDARMLISQLRDEQASISSAELGDAYMKVYGENGVLHIVSDAECTVNIYNTTGLLIRSIDISPGDTTVDNLPRGLYIVNSIKVSL